MSSPLASQILFPYSNTNSFQYLPAIRSADMRWNSGSCSHLNMRRKVSRPDFSFDHGLGLRNKSERVPCDRHKTRCANIACGMLYLFNSALILCANSFVFISSTSLLIDVTVVIEMKLQLCYHIFFSLLYVFSERIRDNCKYHFVVAMIVPDFVLTVRYSIDLYCL